ncbi:MAPEG family protein [Roseibium sp.]|uniref:MAPEG family protein n=1 Tax=Roseibium sp. TaxID=1936156 RepID=UPI003BA9051E
MTIVITPVVASLLALLYVFLSIRVIGARRTERISLGDRGNDLMLRRMRVHSNFAEYTPFALLLLLMLELLGGAHWLLYGLGLFLLVGRSVHAYGVSSDPEPMAFRVTGMLLTFTVIGVTALANLVLSIDKLMAVGRLGQPAL